MPGLTYEDRMIIQLKKNRRAGLQPGTQVEIARKFNLTKAYVNTVIKGSQRGAKSDEWRRKFAAYAGIE